MILAGDIGGTKTNLALFDPGKGDMRTPVAERSYPSQQFQSLERILDRFLLEVRVDGIERAGFGIAGPVVNARVETPNLPWRITREGLARQLGVDQVALVNDLVANALGIPQLHHDQFFTMQEGDSQASGNAALISAGTGCGMALIIVQDGADTVVASEGGHIDFAARNQDEFGLLEYLRARFGRVSYERIVSGPGLHNIYTYLRDSAFADEPDWLAEQIATGDPGAAISGAALAGTSDLARKALDMFVSMYGAMAGNLALMVVATGGLYVGGGIAPKILDKLKDGVFLNSFRHKGRFSPMMERIPIRVILEPKTALYGAARQAARL